MLEQSKRLSKKENDWLNKYINITMKLEIVSLEGIVYQGETNYVFFPGLGGSFDVLPHHAPLIAALQKGVIKFDKEGKTEEQPIGSGFVEIKNDKLSVCIEQL